jgi:hypothetical protein
MRAECADHYPQGQKEGRDSGPIHHSYRSAIGPTLPAVT